MKALTIYQPWASLVILGAKPFEFRAWDYATRYAALVDQRIVIHASARPMRATEIADLIKRCTDDVGAGLKNEIALPLLERLLSAYKCQGVLELSAGLGTVTIGRARRVGDIFKGQVADSDRLDHSLFGWAMGKPEAFAEPAPCRGSQGFWNWPYKVPAHAV